MLKFDEKYTIQGMRARSGNITDDRAKWFGDFLHQHDNYSIAFNWLEKRSFYVSQWTKYTGIYTRINEVNWYDGNIDFQVFQNLINNEKKHLEDLYNEILDLAEYKEYSIDEIRNRVLALEQNKAVKEYAQFYQTEINNVFETVSFRWLFFGVVYFAILILLILFTTIIKLELDIP